MSEQYRKNVQTLCDALSIQNPIDEADLSVEAISFYVEGSETRIEGTTMNCAGRLFFQNRFEAQKYKGSLGITAPFRLSAADFFAENWRDAEEKGRAMLIAFKKASRFKIHWKQP